VIFRPDCGKSSSPLTEMAYSESVVPEQKIHPQTTFQVKNLACQLQINNNVVKTCSDTEASFPEEGNMIRKLKSGKYRLYSKKTDPETGKHKNLGTFSSLAKAKQHERAVQFFKRRH